MKKTTAYLIIACWVFLMVLAAGGCATKRQSNEVRERIVTRDSVSYIRETVIDTVHVPARQVSGGVSLDQLKRDSSAAFTGKDIKATVRYVNNYIEVDCYADSLEQLVLSMREQWFSIREDVERMQTVTEKVIEVKVYPWRLILVLILTITVLVLTLIFSNKIKSLLSWIRK